MASTEHEAHGAEALPANISNVERADRELYVAYVLGPSFAVHELSIQCFAAEWRDCAHASAEIRGGTFYRFAWTANDQSWPGNASLITRISCSAPNGLKRGFAPASITPSTRLSWPVMRITATEG